MIWYDSAFAPASLNKVNANYKTKHAKLMLDADKFLFDYKPENPIDLSLLEYLDDTFTEPKSQVTAYDRIEKILEEAHKKNKNLFGQVIEHSGVEVADEETDALAQTDESVEEKVTENHDDEVIEQAEKFEKSDETESKDDNNLQNTVVEEGDVTIAEEERKSDAVVSTTSGNYEYFGAVDENGLRTGRGRTVSPSGITAYDGEYAQGKRDGFGVFYYKNGDINYVGDWKENHAAAQV